MAADDKGPNNRELAEEYVRSRGSTKDHQGRMVRSLQFADEKWWRWEAGRYEEVSNLSVKDDVRDWLYQVHGRSDPKVPDYVYDHLRAFIRRGTSGLPPCWVMPLNAAEREHEWLAFRNGVLDLSAAIAGQHTFVKPHPRWFSELVLPYEYDQNAKCPTWEKSVLDWVSGDEATYKFLQEFCGYILWPDNHLFETALFLEGSGSNGKTVLINTLESVLGCDNVSSVGVHEFNQDFKLEGTLGKLLNVSPETPDGARLPVPVLRQFISGDKMAVNRKHQRVINHRSRAKLIVAWNERPQASDRTEAFWRRVKLVPFKQNYIGRENRNLHRELIAEAPGILNWMIEGLQRVLKQKQWTSSDEIAECSKAFRAEADHLRHWIKGNVISKEKGVVGKGTIYENYRDWAADQGFDAVRPEQFAKCLRQEFPNLGTSRRGSRRVPHFTGIDLRAVRRT